MKSKARPRIKPPGNVRLQYVRQPRRRAILGATIYFVQAGGAGPIKIGISVDLAARLRQLQDNNHERLRLLRSIKGTDAQEKLIHRRFSHLRVRGEWFRSEPELLSFIDQVTDFLGEQNPAGASPEINPPAVANNLAKKLSSEAVRYIRRSPKTEVVLSNQFGISRSLVGGIRRKERWKHVL
jgi:hypothetical protein